MYKEVNLTSKPFNAQSQMSQKMMMKSTDNIEPTISRSTYMQRRQLRMQKNNGVPEQVTPKATFQSQNQMFISRLIEQTGIQNNIPREEIDKQKQIILPGIMQIHKKVTSQTQFNINKIRREVITNVSKQKGPPQVHQGGRMLFRDMQDASYHKQAIKASINHIKVDFKQVSEFIRQLKHLFPTLGLRQARRKQLASGQSNTDDVHDAYAESTQQGIGEMIGHIGSTPVEEKKIPKQGTFMKEIYDNQLQLKELMRMKNEKIARLNQVRTALSKQHEQPAESMTSILMDILGQAAMWTMVIASILFVAAKGAAWLVRGAILLIKKIVYLVKKLKYIGRGIKFVYQKGKELSKGIFTVIAGFIGGAVATVTDAIQAFFEWALGNAGGIGEAMEQTVAEDIGGTNVEAAQGQAEAPVQSAEPVQQIEGGGEGEQYADSGAPPEEVKQQPPSQAPRFTDTMADKSSANLGLANSTIAQVAAGTLSPAAGYQLITSEMDWTGLDQSDQMFQEFIGEALENTNMTDDERGKMAELFYKGAQLQLGSESNDYYDQLMDNFQDVTDEGGERIHTSDFIDTINGLTHNMFHDAPQIYTQIHAEANAFDTLEHAFRDGGMNDEDSQFDWPDPVPLQPFDAAAEGMEVTPIVPVGANPAAGIGGATGGQAGVASIS